ncbi:MAG: hypothetical protein Q8O31_00405 [Rhodocyclaceae bacterium]|nr:hypothetical protein [Rhodocyclaceae bacterium]
MLPSDAQDNRLLHLEKRRFLAKCREHEPLIVRSETLRDVSRWSVLYVPSEIAEEYEVRGALERLVDLAEARAKEIILGEIENCLKADDPVRSRMIRQVADEWTKLRGPLRHLRAWAQKTLEALQQQRAL